MIVPDDKDWTWVLERSCTECGFDPDTVSFRGIPTRAREVTEGFAELLGEATRDDLVARPDEATWSPLEYAAHVRDVCRIMLSRLNLMLVLENPDFANWDQDRTSTAQDYRSQDADVVADELVAAGDAMATAVALVHDEQLGRSGRRSNGSLFTVETLAQYFLHDLVHHAHDVGLDA